MKSCKNLNCPSINPQILSNFHINRATIDGLQPICKACVANKYKQVKPTTRKNKKHKDYSQWTINTENKFKQLYSIKSITELCKIFHKSESSIKAKARELGLRKISYLTKLLPLDSKISNINSGVYVIVNTNTDKKYIGSTSNIQESLQKHYSSLNSNKHENKDLQNDFNLKNSFSWAICYIGKDYQQVEHKIINTEQNLYNINKINIDYLNQDKRYLDKLLKKTKQVGDCLIWQGKINKDGYGHINGKLIHRLFYHNFKQKIIPGNIILHKCNNKLCVNIEHLEQGTEKENGYDRKLANKNKSSITWELVDQIRQRWLGGEKYRQLQSNFKFNIAPIIYNRTWIDEKYKGYYRRNKRLRGVNCS